MTNPRQRPAVLIVDRDPALIFWLGEIFNEAGCLPIPALDCAHAVSIIQDLGVRLTVVVVNPGLFGVSWMIHTLRRSHGPFRVVSLIDNEVDLASSISDEGTLPLPRHGEPPSHEQWLEQARRVLRHFLQRENGTGG